MNMEYTPAQTEAVYPDPLFIMASTVLIVIVSYLVKTGFKAPEGKALGADFVFVK